MLRLGPAAAAVRRVRLASNLCERRDSNPAETTRTHGRARNGQLFLAMEWLDGEDLSVRRARGPLAVHEAIELASRVASALAVAHAAGIVHRDIKPSNIFLPSGALEQVQILDFGIARIIGRDRATQTGRVIGTPGYMAPEQARGDRSVDARVDVFALGCVLFECLTGRPVFIAERVAALLAKVLFEEPPRLASIAPDLPAELDALLAAMLAKDPEARPAHAGVVGAQLAALVERVRALQGVARTVPRMFLGDSPSRERVTAGEQRLVCVILAEGARNARKLADDFGAETAHLADGTQLVTLASHGTATDHAARMALLALALRDESPGARIALAMGRAATITSPIGPAIDRASALLGGTPDEIRIDEITANLVDGRFELTRGVLVGRRDDDVARRLLGKATPFVGRDKELAILDAIFAECTAEPVARAVLVTGPPGVGKSRLRRELAQRTPLATVWPDSSCRSSGVYGERSHSPLRIPTLS